MVLLSGCHDCMKDIDYPVNTCKLLAKQGGNCKCVQGFQSKTLCLLKCVGCSDKAHCLLSRQTFSICALWNTFASFTIVWRVKAWRTLTSLQTLVKLWVITAICLWPKQGYFWCSILCICSIFHLVTASNLQQPLVNWLWHISEISDGSDWLVSKPLSLRF